MSKAARRGFRERLREQKKLQAKLVDKDAQPGNRTLRRSGALEVQYHEPAHLGRFRRALDKAMRGPKE